MKILVLGSGGREHTFAWKLRQSPRCEALFIAPGNAGTQAIGRNLDIDPNDFEGVKAAVLQHGIDMVVVGPEDPLVNGIVDFFRQDPDLQRVACIGPSQAGAMLEGSKAFAKAFMQEFDIPTAAYREFTNATRREGLDYLDRQPTPIVLKADGLAAGKGVLILHDREAAKAAFNDMLDGKFGKASEKVVVEAFLDGIEFSVFTLTDGKDYLLLPVAKDYKRIGEGDTGLNTGGMGSVSPVPFVDETLMQKVEERIIRPTIAGIQRRGYVYQGFIFFGLIRVNGDPYVIEYNCRMGDPETQVVLPRIQNDLVDLLDATANGRLAAQKLTIDPRTAAAVILVSGGYPEAYAKGKIISGLDQPAGAGILFHAGTKTTDAGAVTNGGRVLAVTSFGDNFRQAVARSIELAGKIDFEDKYFRRDIGFDL